MKRINYRKIKRALKNTYCKPDDESQERLFEKMGIHRGGDSKERRFIATFRIAVAAVALFICLLGINSANPRNAGRYTSKNFATLGEVLATSPQFLKPIFEWSKYLKESP